jgi:nicotinamidase-related amidase
MLNPYEHEDSDRLAESAAGAITPIATFYGTPLEYLLDQQGIARLILTGQVTEQCILYSALDGYVRHFDVVVPRDAVAHIHPNLADAALEMMERNMSAEIVSAANCRLGSD